jgi:hypothetical protein
MDAGNLLKPMLDSNRSIAVSQQLRIPFLYYVAYESDMSSIMV